jgi:hypothetical protein
VNSHTSVCNIFVSNLSISDHFPVCFIRTVKSRVKRGFLKTMKYRSFKTFNEQSFHTDLARSSLESVEYIVDPNLALQTFCSIVKDIISKHAL